MRVLVTGLGGTLAPHLAHALRRLGHEACAWDRAAAPPDDSSACRAMLERLDPGAIAHLALGPEAWAGTLAAHAAARSLPMLFTSTAMVFHHDPDGPHRPHDARTARDDYGRYKIRCEDAVRAACPGACVARIGWQIDDAAHGNNMLAALDEWQRREGRVAASRAWRPACSFMDDTAAALARLLFEASGDTVHLDSNAAEAHSFDRIARALGERCGRNWRVEATEHYRHDQRLVAPPAQRVRLPELSARLPALRS